MQYVSILSRFITLPWARRLFLRQLLICAAFSLRILGQDLLLKVLPFFMSILLIAWQYLSKKDTKIRFAVRAHSPPQAPGNARAVAVQF